MEETNSDWKPTRMYGKCATKGLNWFTAAVGFSERSRNKIHPCKFGGFQIDLGKVRLHVGLLVYVD